MTVHLIQRRYKLDCTLIGYSTVNHHSEGIYIADGNELTLIRMHARTACIHVANTDI